MSTESSRISDSLLDDPATDPALAAVLTDMYRRWPTLARDADHPLADFFSRRRRRFDLRAPLATITAVTVFVGGLIYIPTSFRIPFSSLANPILLFYLARWIYRKLRTYGPSTRLQSPIDLMARLRQPGDSAERITPISPLHVPAIHASVELCRYRRLMNRVMRIVLFILVAAPFVLAPLWYAVASRPSVGAIVPLVGLSIFFGALAGSFIGEHRCVLRSLYGAISKPEPGTQVGCITGFLFLTMAAGTIAVVLNHLLQLVDLEYMDYIPFLIAFLLVGSGISAIADHHARASRLDEEYCKILERMSMEADRANESSGALMEREATQNG